MKRFAALGLLIALLNVVACSSAPHVSCRGQDGATKVDRLKDHLMREAADGFSGAVLVGDGDDVVLSAEYGDAQEDDRPTPYWIASITKAITAAAVLRLVEEGRIDLDTTISSYLPDVPDQWRHVTVHHLLGGHESTMTDRENHSQQLFTASEISTGSVYKIPPNRGTRR